MRRSIDHSHMMSIEKDKESIKAAPKPFNTSRLLQVASNVVNTGPKLTMQLCQSLYQNGYITYIRTDSTKYAPPFLVTAKTYISDTECRTERESHRVGGPR